MKVAFVLGLVAFAISSTNSLNTNDWTEVIEEEWGLFKVCVVLITMIVEPEKS